MKTIVFKDMDDNTHALDIKLIKKTQDTEIYRVKSTHGNYTSINIKDTKVKVLTDEKTEIKGTLIKIFDNIAEKLYIYGGEIYATATNIKVDKEINGNLSKNNLKSKSKTSKYKIKANNVDIILQSEGYEWKSINPVNNVKTFVIEDCQYTESKTGTACCVILNYKLEKFELHSIKECTKMIE